MDMNMKEDKRDFSDPETWDEGEIQQPAKQARAVVSVAFSPDDLARITSVARQRDLTASAFIRNATLECIARERPRTM